MFYRTPTRGKGKKALQPKFLTLPRITAYLINSDSSYVMNSTAVMLTIEATFVSLPISHPILVILFMAGSRRVTRVTFLCFFSSSTDADWNDLTQSVVTLSNNVDFKNKLMRKSLNTAFCFLVLCLAKMYPYF